MRIEIVSYVNGVQTGREEVSVNEGSIVNVMQEVSGVEEVKTRWTMHAGLDHEPVLVRFAEDPDEPTCEVCGRHMDMVWIHGGAS